MDILILILLAAGLFALALLSASLWSIVVAWRTAANRGLSITFFEARALTKFFELEHEFLDTCLEFKQFDATISVVDLVRHHMADGDTRALLDYWKQLKAAESDIPFKSLILYHLAGKDIAELVHNHNREYELVIPEIEEHGLQAYYYCKFKIASDSAGWIDPDMEVFKQLIEEKVKLALLSGDLSDFEALAAFIKEEYLNAVFWNNLCHGQVIDQQIRITKG